MIATTKRAASALQRCQWHGAVAVSSVVRRANFASIRRFSTDDISARPFRSVLYVPASNEGALKKASVLPADAIVFDLEDAVAPERKAAARENLVSFLKSNDCGRRTRIVRINGAGTPWHRDDVDLSLLIENHCDSILIPKTNSAEDVDVVAEQIPSLALWTMIETPSGVLNAHGIASHHRVLGLVIGSNDLSKELNCTTREGLMTSLQHCLLAARCSDKICIDGVYNAFKDTEGLRKECRQGREWGFDGKTLIHPQQISVTNEVFCPSEEEISLAKKTVEVFESAVREGKGVAVLNGAIVENLHVESARKLLEKAEAMSGLQNQNTVQNI